MIEEIRDFLKWRGGTLGGDHQVGYCGFGSHSLTLMAAFFLDFPIAGLGAAVGFGSGFSGLAILLVVVTVCCSGASVIGLGVGFGFGLVAGVVVALCHPPLPPLEDVISPLQSPLVRMASFYSGCPLSSLVCHWLFRRAGRRGLSNVVPLAGALKGAVMLADVD